MKPLRSLLPSRVRRPPRVGFDVPPESPFVRRLHALRERFEAIPPRRGALVGAVFGLLLGLVCFFVVPGWPSLIVATVICAAVLWGGATSRLVFSAPSIAVEDAEPYAVVGPATDVPNELIPMIGLPRGTFWMGSTPEERSRLIPAEHQQEYEDESPRHQVAVGPFAIGVIPVTRRHWHALKLRTPAKWRHHESQNLPANHLDWFDAIRYCNRLSLISGLTPCYRRAKGRWLWDRDADGYRLPTEAEWEYAFRAGSATTWFCGDDDHSLSEFANYNKPFGLGPQEVGQRRPNPWGLFDMAGNIWEWCWDDLRRFDAASGVEKDPTGPDQLRPAVRGGAYWRDSRFLRSANRDHLRPENKGDDVGFRVVRAPRRQQA